MATQYVSPVTGTWAAKSSSPFKARRWTKTKSGKRIRRYHSGNDLQAKTGSPAVAVIGGKVIYAKTNKGYGPNAVVLGDDGNAYRYALHGPLSVKYGQRVEQGDTIGKIGESHLHFEVAPKGSPFIQEQLNAGNNFVYTSWYPGNQPKTVDPAAFFGAELGAVVTAGKPFGDASTSMMTAYAPEKRTSTEAFDAVLSGDSPDIGASLRAADILGDSTQVDDTSPFVNAQDPSFLPMKSPAVAPLEREQIADIQAILDEQGYKPGPIDGIAGKKTSEAAAKFRQDRGLEGNAVDRDLARSLIDTTPPYSPQPPSMNRPEDYIADAAAGRDALPKPRPAGGAMAPPSPSLRPVPPAPSMNRPEDYIDNPMAGRNAGLIPTPRPVGGAMDPPIPGLRPLPVNASMLADVEGPPIPQQRPQRDTAAWARGIENDAPAPMQIAGPGTGADLYANNAMQRPPTQFVALDPNSFNTMPQPVRGRMTPAELDAQFARRQARNEYEANEWEQQNLPGVPSRFADAHESMGTPGYGSPQYASPYYETLTPLERHRGERASYFERTGSPRGGPPRMDPKGEQGSVDWRLDPGLAQTARPPARLTAADLKEWAPYPSPVRTMPGLDDRPPGSFPPAAPEPSLWDDIVSIPGAAADLADQGMREGVIPAGNWIGDGISDGLGAIGDWINPRFADATLPPGPGAGMNSTPLGMKDQSRVGPYNDGRPSDAIPGEAPHSVPALPPYPDTTNPIDMTPAGLPFAPTPAAVGAHGAIEGMFGPGAGLGATNASTVVKPGLVELGPGEPGWTAYNAGNQPPVAPTPATTPTVDLSAPTDIRSPIASGNGYTAPDLRAAAPVPQPTEQDKERFIAGIVDRVVNSGIGGMLNPFSGTSIPSTDFATPNGHGGTMTGVSGPGPFSGGDQASEYLGSQSWKSPNFDPKSGGSTHPYFTDPSTGTGGYVDNQRDVHTYAI